MVSYRDLFEVNLRYTDYVREKSLTIHQYMKNISASGAGVENEVRQILESILPARFKVTSGYIISAESRAEEPAVSPQVDILIVDTLVPHSLWVVDQAHGIEMVPVEAVVGIIEVKRTLDAGSIASATEHIRDIVTASRVRKDDETQYLPGGLVVGGGLDSPYRGNPLLGIIGLVAADDFADIPGAITSKAIAKASANSNVAMLDFALALSGTFAAVADENGRYEVATVRASDRLSRLLTAESSTRHGSGGRVALAHGLGYIQAYIGKTCGRTANVENYFFNDSIR
ncbi:DUF6602 domain-containing protein [Nocardia sp. NPDC050175]|uniref:DUF6602 domain-containing protein n=1 Tax=Nocardia sp. NPDC050175 TaxID=3364317 RepID=UPI00378E6F67